MNLILMNDGHFNIDYKVSNSKINSSSITKISNVCKVIMQTWSRSRIELREVSASKKCSMFVSLTNNIEKFCGNTFSLYQTMQTLLGSAL